MAEPYLSGLLEKISVFDLQTLDKDGLEVELEARHFFGGAALYANGKICASWTPAGFGLKLPEPVLEDTPRLRSLLLVSIRYVTLR